MTTDLASTADYVTDGNAERGGQKKQFKTLGYIMQALCYSASNMVPQSKHEVAKFSTPEHFSPHGLSTALFALYIPDVGNVIEQQRPLSPAVSGVTI